VRRQTEAVRWYTHGWNRDLSWRLILGIIPKIPRALRPPIHFATSLTCFVAMPRERRAARRNLERITGRRGLASRLLAFRQFYDFSKFMVAFTDLTPFRPEVVRPWIENADEAARTIDGLLAEGKGLIVLTLHLGNWEMGLAFLARHGSPVSIVLRPEDRGPVRFEREARAHPGVRTVAAGESAWNGLDLLLGLRRGEIVAIQGDRPFGSMMSHATLFGAPLDLPGGPFALAQASGAPILIVCVPILGHWRYRIHLDGPLRVAQGEDAVQRAVADFARRVEGIVACYPTQWFNFFDMWAGAGAPGPARRS
jgi:Kdo2-lipid IVA lauroyltransferase/acyltransferase